MVKRFSAEQTPETLKFSPPAVRSRLQHARVFVHQELVGYFRTGQNLDARPRPPYARCVRLREATL